MTCPCAAGDFPKRVAKKKGMIEKFTSTIEKGKLYRHTVLMLILFILVALVLMWSA